MREQQIQNPGLAYTASRLGEYAHAHGVDTERMDPFNDSSVEVRPAQVLRHGHALPPDFEVSQTVPRTIPILIGRLAIFDSRLCVPAHEFASLDARMGVSRDSVRWLRLVKVEPDDERVGEILSIVDARLDNKFEGIEQDQRDNPNPYTGHYYMESNQYAVKVIQYAHERHLGIPVTGVEFMLPSTQTIYNSNLHRV